VSTEPLVSIALPAFNADRTIGPAIRSILLQTYSNWELLLADDGPTGNTLRIARTFADSRIVILPSRGKQGLSRRLNECIDRAQGTYFARMDADDIAYPERFRKQIAFLQANPSVDLVGSQTMVFGEGGRAIGRRSGPCVHELITKNPIHGFRMFHPTWLGKLAWFRKYRYEPEPCEDQDMLFRAFPDSVYANIPDILLGYREESLDLSKTLLSRWTWVKRTARRQPLINNFPALASVAVAMGLKASMDCIAVATGLDHRLFRHRAWRASEKEMEDWKLVWSLTQDPCPAQVVLTEQ
jgi:glycosyltransferase involved in cell wall biosynthesis